VCGPFLAGIRDPVLFAGRREENLNADSGTGGSGRGNTGPRALVAERAFDTLNRSC